MKKTLIFISLITLLNSSSMAAEDNGVQSTTSATTQTAATGSVTVSTSMQCQATSPCFIVKDTTTKLLDAMNKSTSQTQTIAKITSIASPKFDFKLMTKYAMGSNWKLATAAEQNQLVDLFTQLLQYTYSVALSKFQGAQITLTGSTINPTNNPNNFTAAVISQVVLPNGSDHSTKNQNQAVKVEYDLVSYASQPWRAYDIKIEDTSLVTTYRNQFNDVVQTQKITGLIKQLQTKINSLHPTNNTTN